MKPLTHWTMNELIGAYPDAVTILEAHGVNPLTRCPQGVRSRLTVKRVLGRTCPVDDAHATLADLNALVERGAS